LKNNFDIKQQKLETLIQKTKFYKSKGCDKCNYKKHYGEMGVFEIIKFNNQTLKLINEKANYNLIKAKSAVKNLLKFEDDLLNKINQGKISFTNLKKNF
jgi:type II secretory ATPase GspE/PulE/Tfp pilus assembly ATPase PilB-like protein